MTTLQKIIVGAALAVTFGSGVYVGARVQKWRQASTLPGQIQALQQQQASAAEQIQSLQRERDEAANRLEDDITRRAEATSNKVRLLSSSLLVDDPMRSAYATYAAYMIANAGKSKSINEIPPAYWAAGIKQLNPVKVYIHQVNIVVVQRVTDGIEEGKYICIPLSSYGSPRTGDDGFVLSRNPSDGKTFPLGYQIFDFKRTTSK
jgi:outer membrane murein-binding lipoprotein Lpp